MAARGGHVTFHDGSEGGFAHGLTRRVGMTPEEIGFVRAKRRAGVGWQNCADMVGRNVHDVRMLCDPDYGPATVARAMAQVSQSVADMRPRLQVVAAVTPVANGPRERRRLGAVARPGSSMARILGVLDAGPATTASVSLAMGYVSHNTAQGALKVMEDDGRAVADRSVRPFIWRLTPEGADALKAAGAATGRPEFALLEERVLRALAAGPCDSAVMAERCRAHPRNARSRLTRLKERGLAEGRRGSRVAGVDISRAAIWWMITAAGVEEIRRLDAIVAEGAAHG